jgi:arginyl-tRNA synthetase
MFKPQALPRLLIPYINDRKGTYGQELSIGLRDPLSPGLGRQKLLVEFSSPNIASEFQGKHLRSTIIGAYIGNLYETMGWEVLRLNYLGDWGKPIGLLGIGWEKFGSEELFQTNPTGHLLDVYNKINEKFIPEQIASKKARDEGEDTADIEAHGLFAERNAYCRRLEEGEETAIAFWRRVRDISIENYKKFYSQLGVTFDEYSGESQVDAKTLTEVEGILTAKGLVEQKGGAWTIDLKKHAKKSGMAILRDRTGSSTYLLRDLSAVLERSRKYSFDKMIYVVAADQHTVHFSRLFKILELMDMSDLASKLQYVSFSEAPQMSKNAVHGHMLGEILTPYRTAMQKSLEQHQQKAALLPQDEYGAMTLAITALLTQELSTRRGNDHAFDIDQVTSFDTGTGPDLQYCYARLCSVLEAGPSRSEISDEELSFLVEEDQTNLLRVLIQYPDVTHGAYRTMEAAPVLAYLFNVTGHLSNCLEKSDGSPRVTSPQLMLYEATRTVLENGMKLLGITPSLK